MAIVHIDLVPDELKNGKNTTTKSQSCVKIMKLPIQKIISIKKKGQYTKKNPKAVLKL